MNKSALLQERAELLARLKEIESALSAYSGPVRSVTTSKNLKNSSGVWPGAVPDGYVCVSVYADRELTKFASPADHGGFVDGESAAWLISNGYGEYVE